MPDVVPIAVIGTCGREPGRTLNASTFASMSGRSKDAAAKLAGGLPWRAVSGGGAWSDHVAVVLFLTGAAAELELHLAAPLHFDGYAETGAVGPEKWRVDPGAALNEVHFAFAAAANRDPFVDLAAAASRPGFVAHMASGFAERNARIAAAATHCIALTFGQRSRIGDRGTANVVRMFVARQFGRSVHIDLNSMTAYSPARLLT